jgi:DNA-binding HxlR family transcriptional regulator
MKEGIASVERPTLALGILLFLQRNCKATLSDMISEGWNRRTLETTLRKLRDLELLEVESSKSFPYFKKEYILTLRGGYIANFVNHMEYVLKSRLECGVEDLSTFPKGCVRILVHIHRRGWDGIANILEQVRISPNQAYRCLEFLAKKGILTKEEHQRGKQVFSSYSLSNVGVHIAVTVDALDRALRRHHIS